MKKILKIAGILILLVGVCLVFKSENFSVPMHSNSVAHSPSVNQTLEQSYIQCFRTGNTSILSPFFAKNILFMSDDGEDIFSASETKNTLDLFFTNNPPHLFMVKHHSQSGGGKSRLLIGEYTDKSTKKFRITASVINEKIDMFEVCSENAVLF